LHPIKIPVNILPIYFNFRTTSTGICSGAARIGAITGIMIGELNLLHSSLIVNTLAAIGGFQLLDLIITELKIHMTCYNSMPLIG